MAFSQSTITSVNPPAFRGSQVYISWTSSAAPGTWYQVYLDDVLAWYGQTTSVSLPVPTDPPVRIDIGTVGWGEEQTSFAGSLPAAPLRQVELNWLGGTYEGTDLAGFNVYGEAAPGAGINYSDIFATITAYAAGIYTDGYGMGGFGLGGFGESSSAYSWTSDTLTSGTWHWGVKPFDTAGNEGTAETASAVIAVPPLEPAPFSDGLTLHYTYSQPTKEITLLWNASP
jgi:hypothetical protein